MIYCISTFRIHGQMRIHGAKEMLCVYKRHGFPPQTWSWSPSIQRINPPRKACHHWTTSNPTKPQIESYLFKCSSRQSLQNLWPQLVWTGFLSVKWHIKQRTSSSPGFKKSSSKPEGNWFLRVSAILEMDEKSVLRNPSKGGHLG